MRKQLLFIFFILISELAFSTHQRAGEITYTALSDLKYEFTIVTYTYTPSPADRPELEIDWGDGTSQMVLRTQKINYPNNISRNVYAGALHTFPGQGTYLISVEDPNRNYGVLNIPNSVNVPFFIQSQLVINPFLGPNSSVELLAPPIDIGCVNNLFLHNPAAFDVDGDSLSFQLVDCRGAFGLPIPGYILPNQVDPTVEASFAIDPVTGTIAWEKPILQGEYNIAFLIEEWRYGIRIGYVTRDMQITILACNNASPVIGRLHDTCVMAGTTLSFEVSAIDPDGDTLTIGALGGPFQVGDSPATFPPATGYNGSVVSTFTWNTNCAHIQFQPYQVVFTARDSLKFPRLTDIRTVSITIVSPPPQNLSATPVNNNIHLSWNKAVCPQTLRYFLYRRNGYYGFEPGPCETGVPAYTAYQKIATLEGISDTTFIDDNNGTGLIHGVDYCYLVVAAFDDGSQSYASQEVCASLIKNVPVITHVSVLETSTDQGEIHIAWSPPAELDTLIFGGPYKYSVFRSDNQNSQLVEIAQTYGINDTTFFDTSGLNTADLKYSYQIAMYSLMGGGEELIGTTQLAKSMFLQISPTDEALQLSWNQEVPWANSHYIIYRRNSESLVFDSVGFSSQRLYTDSNLINEREYTYFIESFGRYSTQGMVDPIINFSQINSGIPSDIVPPCTQVLSVKTNCVLIQNDLSWQNTEGCRENIAGYYIYYQPSINDSAVVLDSIFDPEIQSYSHTNIPSIAGCYEIRAFDSVGNLSDLSNKVCVSINSCSTYRLPNVFTPNQDEYNEYFKPFPEYTSIDRIKIKIFNRWGKIVFETENPEINWDGKNMNNHQDCAEGVYFYVCEIFEIQFEGLTKRTLTGSVTLLR